MDDFPLPVEGHEWKAHEATRVLGAPGEVDEQGWLRKISVVPKPYQKPHPPVLQALTTNEETIRWAARSNVCCRAQARRSWSHSR